MTEETVETSTLDLLYIEIDNSMIDTASFNGNHSSLANSRSSSSSRISQRSETSGVNLSELKKRFESNSDELLSPFKVKDNELRFKKSPLKNGVDDVKGKGKGKIGSVANRINSLELLSGGTCVDSEKSIGIHKKSPEQKDHNNSTLPILRENSSVKPFNLPNSLSLDSTKPLLQYVNGNTNVTNEDDGKTDVEEDNENIRNELNESPQLVTSPSRIPLTDAVKMNKFIDDNEKLVTYDHINKNLNSNDILTDTPLRDDISDRSTAEIKGSYHLVNTEDSEKVDAETIAKSIVNEELNVDKTIDKQKMSILGNSSTENTSESQNDFASANDQLNTNLSELSNDINDVNNVNDVIELSISTGLNELNITEVDINETLKTMDESELNLETTEEEMNLNLIDESLSSKKILPENIEKLYECIKQNPNAHEIEHSQTSNMGNDEQEPIVEDNTDQSKNADIEVGKDNIQMEREKEEENLEQEQQEKMQINSTVVKEKEIDVGEDEGINEKQLTTNAQSTDVNQKLPVDAEHSNGLQLREEDNQGFVSENVEPMTNKEVIVKSTKTESEEIQLPELVTIETKTHKLNETFFLEREPSAIKLKSNIQNEKQDEKEQTCRCDLETFNNSLTTENDDLASVIYEPLHENPSITEEALQMAQPSINETTTENKYEEIILDNTAPCIEHKTEQRKISESSNSQFSKDDVLSISTLETPVLRSVSKFDSIFVDDLFGDEGDTTAEFNCKNKTVKPDNYLAIWHVQESNQPAVEKPILPTQNQRIVSKVLTENVRYSFKPKIVHHPKYHYLNKDAQTALTTSLSQQFEGALKILDADVQPVPSPTKFKRPMKIWPEPRNPSYHMENTKSTIIEDMFGENIDSSVIKTPSKAALVNKAVSIKSVLVDFDYNDSIIKQHNPAGQTFKNSSVSDPDESLRPKSHCCSPFKIKGRKEAFSTAPDNDDEYNYDSSQNYTMLDIDANPDNIELDSKESVLKDIEINELLEEVEKDPQEFVDEGVYYLNMNKVRVNLSEIKKHKAKMCIHIDNGINSIQTEWKQIEEDGELVLDNELEIPITKDVYKLTLTLKCKYERPQNELKEVIQKVPVSKSSIFARKKYNYERRYVRQKVEHDDWDYLFANDGTYAQLEIGLSEDFLTYNEMSIQHVEIKMINRWAKLYSKYMNDKPIKDLPRRQPFPAATFYYDSYYSRRVSSLESFPKTLTQAIKMARQLNLQNSIVKEGCMLQDGGDLNGLLEKRYFKLQGTRLIGYHEVTMKPKIEINLLNVVDITDNTNTEPSGRNFTNLFLFGECFQLLFKDGEQMSFTCQMSGSETRQWFYTIKQVIDLNVTHQPWIKKLAARIQ